MRRYPGFDFLRILAACAVVFSHSFLIAEGSEKNEPFEVSSGEIVAVYGVMVFFILSGFLISDSAIRTPSAWQFTLKRVSRLVPAFLVCNLIVVAFICSAYSTAGILFFLTDWNTWQHLISVLTLQEDLLHYSDTVAFYVSPEESNSWLPATANGVLWTIRVEISCYAIVGLMSASRMISSKTVLLLACLAVASAFSYEIQINKFLGDFFFLLPSFATGMVLSLYASKHKTDGVIAAASAAVLVTIALLVPGWQQLEVFFFPLFAAYPLLWIGEQNNAFFQWLRQYGDPSYGMYLWGWPLQQVLRSAIEGDWSGYTFFPLCIPAIICAGYISWHVVERPFLIRRVRPISEKPR